MNSKFKTKILLGIMLSMSLVNLGGVANGLNNNVPRGVGRRGVIRNREDSTDINDLNLRLIEAVSNNNLNMVRFLLDHGANPDAEGEDGSTPLSRALFARNLDMCCLLLERGADANDVYERGITPLHYAIKYEFLDVIPVLLRHRANPDAVDENGDTPFYAAVRAESMNGIWFLLRNGIVQLSELDEDGLTGVLCLAARESDVDLAREVLDVNAGIIDNAEYEGRTPLIFATVCDGIEGSIDVDMVRLLLERGADPNARATSDETPLYGAVLDNNVGAIRLLLEAGANVNEVDGENKTPLYHAIGLDFLDVIPVLLEHGANVGARDNYGYTPLMYAMSEGSDSALFRAFLDAGVDVNVLDDENKTALYRAVEQRDAEMVRTLLGAGADRSWHDVNGHTLLDFAREIHEQSVQRLAEWEESSGSPQRREELSEQFFTRMQMRHLQVIRSAEWVESQLREEENDSRVVLRLLNPLQVNA